MDPLTHTARQTERQAGKQAGMPTHRQTHSFILSFSVPFAANTSVISPISIQPCKLASSWGTMPSELASHWLVELQKRARDQVRLTLACSATGASERPGWTHTGLFSYRTERETRLDSHWLVQLQKPSEDQIRLTLACSATEAERGPC